ncbi:adhesion G protein-coupled receptor L3-like [Ruditapes philippinarum]|uniref:adhesion G protein-coupled receptor L3-like n=1 Tax=Ruditapes philippinarum TaxID=129788 RepID=UPI00295A895B|nr:adhesion G protein-coupled receptor L3-like [Ruditapes philippinarum]
MMVSHITTTIGLTLLVTSYGVQAYSTGAPDLSCEDMIPLGHSTQIPDTSNNYKFSANVTRLTYCVGDEIFINIGLPAGDNRTFKGFLCQARSSLDMFTPLGNLTSNNTYATKPTCNTTASVTHASSDAKQNIRLVWTPNEGMTSTVSINCTIVVDFTTFVHDITTKNIFYGNQQCQSGTPLPPVSSLSSSTTPSFEQNLTTTRNWNDFTTDVANNFTTVSPTLTSFLTPTLDWDLTTPDFCECKQPETPVNGEVVVADGTAVFTCNAGHVFGFPPIEGNQYEVFCFCGVWSNLTNVTCVPIDCGGNFALNNGNVYSGDGTTFGAAIVFICNTGYELIGPRSAVCMANGLWSSLNSICRIVECSRPEIPGNGSITTPQTNTTFGSVVTYECNTGFVLDGHQSIRCLSSGIWSGSTPLCIPDIEDKRPKECGSERDYRGTLWETTSPGVIVTKPCLNGYQGESSRKCTLQGQWMLPVYNCVRESIEEITKLIEGAKENPSETVVNTVLSNLTQATDTDVDDALYDGELKLITETLENIVVLSDNITVNDGQIQNFIKTASNIVDKKNVNSWRAVNQQTAEGANFRPADVLRAVDGYSKVVANSTRNDTVIKQSNILFRVTNNNKENIMFPTPRLATELQTLSFYFLSNVSLDGVKKYSSIFYKNLTEILPTSSVGNNSDLEINGAVLSLTLIPSKEDLETPIELSFQHFNTFYRYPVCSFWNFDSNGWDSDGCTMVSTNNEVTNCTCSHLTNFAILMSPYKQEVSKPLNIISTVGCGISLFGLVLTIVAHVTFWRHVKSERALLVVCLSAALIIFYAIFIVGVEKTENKDVCTVVAVSLHFCLLVVFFMMLAASVHIAISILYVFRTKVRSVKWLIPLAIGVPLLIVAISASITKMDGYGTEDYCWLSSDNGLVWAFIGPAILVICVNVILLVLILKTMHSTKMMTQKSGSNKMKATVKCLCVLLPVMGVTWVTGLFYVNEDTNWIQYLFATVNSLQGLVIFVFHCVLNKQIQRAFILAKRKYSVGTSESRLANELKKMKSRESFDKVET